MPTYTLPGRMHSSFTLELDRPKLGLHVEAERPITVYVLDQDSLAAFYANENARFYSHGGFTNQHVHEQRIRLPYAGTWYVVIMNRGDEETAVHYEFDYR